MDNNDAQSITKRRVRTKRNTQKIRQQRKILAAPAKKEVTEIFCLSTHPPKECGIATFSDDLRRSLKNKFNGSFTLTVCPLETETERHPYPDDIELVLNTDRKQDFVTISSHINDNPNIALVLIQHEFGLFKNNEKAFEQFLKDVDRPVAVTFHTVLPEPDDTLREKVKRIAKECSNIIVMTRSSKEILMEDYQIDADTVEVIPHGTHLVSYEDADVLKAKYDLSGKTILSTFGLLGPGKSIETTLHALPGIVKEFPDTMFLIIGKTHPSLSQDFGEDYRLFLESLVEKLYLQDHVKFINKFVPTPELLEYLQLTDIYLFTSKDPNQAVSGTFAYALSCGCPVVSTPIPHALEVLQNQAGVVFDFSDSDQLRQVVLDLLDDRRTLQSMSLNGLHTSAASAWENAALAHANLFERLTDTKVTLNYLKPPVDLKHLKKMTSEVGIAQFCKINQPDMAYGYTLDDNARALIAFCRHFKKTGETEDLEYIKRYFMFLKGCFRPDGKFWNYVDKDCQFTEQNEEVNLEDSNGRTIWALGYLLSVSDRFPKGHEPFEDKIHFLFEQSLNQAAIMQSPRAMAFTIKGLYYYSLHHGSDCVGETISILADRLLGLYDQNASDDWHWFEEYLTYGNAVMPQSMLMAYIVLGRGKYRNAAKKTFDFLLDKIFTEHTIRVISNKKWMSRGEPFDKSFQGGEQPIDVAYTILALDLFDKEFPEAGYGLLKQKAFDWFLGNNPLRQTIYNPCTGGCYDGIELNNVNLNQGAESTISYLLARMTFKENW